MAHGAPGMTDRLAAVCFPQTGGGGGRRVTVTVTEGPQTIFCKTHSVKILFLFFAKRHQGRYPTAMSFYSIPFAPDRAAATEARLEAIYEAARYGLKGDTLAMRVGLTPTQYRRLAEFDPLVEMAELKGRADGEYSAGKTLHDAAAQGDAKAALEILKHQHGWRSAQSLEITVEGQISVLAALEKAQTRVIQGLYTEVGDAPTSPRSLTNQQEEFVDGYRSDNARAPAKSTGI